MMMHLDGLRLAVGPLTAPDGGSSAARTARGSTGGAALDRIAVHEALPYRRAALVGWYLMMPPIRDASLRDVAIGRCPQWICCPDGEQSLTQWEIIESFDSAEQCRNERDSNQAKVMNNSGSPQEQCSETTPGLDRWTYAQCTCRGRPDKASTQRSRFR